MINYQDKVGNERMQNLEGKLVFRDSVQCDFCNH